MKLLLKLHMIVQTRLMTKVTVNNHQALLKHSQVVHQQAQALQNLIRQAKPKIIKIRSVRILILFQSSKNQKIRILITKIALKEMEQIILLKFRYYQYISIKLTLIKKG